MTKKLTSFILTLVMCVTLCVPAFAQSYHASEQDVFSEDNTVNNESFFIDGKEFTVTRMVTNNYSRAITKDASGATVADISYYPDQSTFVDNLRNMIMSTGQTSVNGIALLADDESKYVYRYTDRYDFTVAKYTSIALATALATALPGIGLPVLVAVVEAAIADKLDSIYYTQDVYTYTENKFFHIKRVTDIYGDDGSHLGGPWTTYQTVHEK